MGGREDEGRGGEGEDVDMGRVGQVEKDKRSYMEIEAMNAAITCYCRSLLQNRKLNFTLMKAPKTGVKENLFFHDLGPAVILGVYLVCLGTENCRKPSNVLFFGPELIYVGKSIQEKISEQLL